MYSDRFLSDTSRYAFTRDALISLLGMLMLPLVLAGCSDNPVGGDPASAEGPGYDSSPATFEVEGTIVQQQINGGKAWVIENERGQSYLPINFQAETLTEGTLSEETLKEGTEVRAEVEQFEFPRNEGRRDRIHRQIDRYPGRLVQIRSIKVLSGSGEEALRALVNRQDHTQDHADALQDVRKVFSGT